MKKSTLALLALSLSGLSFVRVASAEAQQWQEALEGCAGSWCPQNLRPSGQPVVPIFDGWIQEPDGTATLCFGYFSLNYDEALEISIGRNNRVEPDQHNGLQPTRLNPVPLKGRNKPRHYCVFTVNVPQGSDQDVVWTLNRGHTNYSVPGRATSLYYSMPDIYWSSEVVGEGGSVAPLVRWLQPTGPEGIGRGIRGGKRAGAISAKVGQPVTLSLAVRQPTSEEFSEIPEGLGPGTFEVTWQKYSGPPNVVGNVTFSQNVTEVGPVEGLATTLATFEEPGEYVLLVQALGGRYTYHCCWTNAFVQVNVTP